jgi:hypothetical protein
MRKEDIEELILDFRGRKYQEAIRLYLTLFKILSVDVTSKLRSQGNINRVEKHRKNYKLFIVIY